MYQVVLCTRSLPYTYVAATKPQTITYSINVYYLQVNEHEKAISQLCE